MKKPQIRTKLQMNQVPGVEEESDVEVNAEEEVEKGEKEESKVENKQLIQRNQRKKLKKRKISY